MNARNRNRFIVNLPSPYGRGAGGEGFRQATFPLLLPAILLAIIGLCASARILQAQDDIFTTEIAATDDQKSAPNETPKANTGGPAKPIGIIKQFGDLRR
jgi:hypothetical protein